MSTELKRQKLQELGKKRRATSIPGYRGIGEYRGGVYECEHVSPYTKTAGNVDSPIMVLLQDWSSDGKLSGPVDPDAVTLGFTPKFPTNRNLARLLDAHFGLGLSHIYATNLFPYIKRGGMVGPIPMKDMVWAAREFALPQIEIVAPRLVICLGTATFNAVRLAVGLPAVKNLDEGLADPADLNSAQVWGQAHTGARGQSSRKRHDQGQVDRDWQRMTAAYEAAAAGKSVELPADCRCRGATLAGSS